MRRSTRNPLVSLALILCLLLILSSLPLVFSSSYQDLQVNFSTANSSISSAYVQIYKIEQNGGNATTLAAQLNLAIGLYDKALSENSSNPGQSMLDLQNATQIANSVKELATPIAQKALSQREQQNAVSIAESIIVIIVALLVYFFGERVYNWIWLRQRKDYLVVIAENG